MKRRIIILLMGIGIMFIAKPALSGETGHYVCGVEGIKLGSVPSPGFYYKVYNVFYNTHAIKDNHGDLVHLRPDIQDYIMVHRPIWVTKKTLLGAHYFATVLIPFAYADFSIKGTGTRDSRWSYGDICFEFFGLSWNRKRFDALVSLAVYAPTGEHSRHQPASLGKDFWTFMVSSGGTFFLDQNRLWALSLLTRYEVHSTKHRQNIRPGQDLSVDWAVSRTFFTLWDIGITGYAHWQMTPDSGSDVNWTRHVHDRVFAAGPEIKMYVPFLRVIWQLRHQIEFGARDRSQGAITNISFTLIF